MSITLGADPAEINLNVVRGATFRKKITVKEGETEETAIPVDYTGAIAEMQIRNIDDPTELYHTMSTATGGITLSAVGEITFFISKEDSTAFPWTLGEYESLEITYANGDRDGFSRGVVSVGRELTEGN